MCNYTTQDEAYMRLALSLAEKGCGHVNPNPMVGAVIVKDGRIIGQGYHAAYGELHAERAALASCTESPEGADLYVTLEPCCHHGKQPPCTDAILEHGIRRVYVGSGDSNPNVAGKGIQILRDHGVEVVEHVLEAECIRLNEVFFSFIQTRRPYVVMKYAMTMDGKIATVTGASRWITGEAARNHVHESRNRYMAIMVGIGTVLADDPLLSCRIPGGRNPIRIVCDSHLRIPLESRLVKTAHEIPTILATCETDPTRQMPYRQAGCQVLVVPETSTQKVDLTALMEALGRQNIDSVLLEGGSTLNWSALQSGIVQKVQTYLAPKLFGGKSAAGPVSGIGVDLPDNAYRLTIPTVTRLGEDLLLESEVIPCSPAS